MLKIEGGSEHHLNGSIIVIDEDPNSLHRIKYALENEKNLFTIYPTEIQTVLPKLSYGVIVLGNCSKETVSSVKKYLPTTKNKIIAILKSDNVLETVEIKSDDILDFIHHQHTDKLLKFAVRKALYINQLEKELEKFNTYQRTDEIILTKSSIMIPILKKIDDVADLSTNVFISGENGIGKSIIARAIHDKSSRNTKRFIKINCASIPEPLLERELFGTISQDPEYKQIGKLLDQQIGTIFLDEVDEMPESIQLKMIDFLSNKLVNPISSRVRLISASHINLSSKAKNSQFHPELYKLLNEIELRIPPLRERGDDVCLLAKKFLIQLNQKYHRNIKGFTDDVFENMLNYSWPGNIRELENKIKSAVIMSVADYINSSDLMLKKEQKNEEVRKFLKLKQVREQAERQAISLALTRAAGNLSQAATMLGVSRPTLYALIDKYSLHR